MVNDELSQKSEVDKKNIVNFIILLYFNVSTPIHFKSYGCLTRMSLTCNQQINNIYI